MRHRPSGTSGYEVARVLRHDTSHRGVYLVALDGYARPDDRRRATEAGFSEHLAKPPSIDRLKHLLVAPIRGK